MNWQNNAPSNSKTGKPALALTDRDIELAGREWLFNGRLDQLPRQDTDRWLVIGGRGSGKTRLGAEWVNACALGLLGTKPTGPIALIGETLNDAREVMVEGPAGILASVRHGRPKFEPSRRRLHWEQTGMVAYLFSAEDPESLRGPQFAAAWADEIGKWKKGNATWDMLQFGLRLGPLPKCLATTTPRPVPLVRRLIADPSVRKTRLRTRDNRANLAPGFVEAMERQFAGSPLGRQELEGELIEDRQDALWSRGQIESLCGPVPRDLRRIIVAVDPPASSHDKSDACGIVVAGLDACGMAHVLADASMNKAKPNDWALRVSLLFRELEADCVIAEVNQGGDMVSSVLRTVDPFVPVKPVRAMRGKWLRAEPVAALYAQGKVRHAGRFPELEDEMCNFGRDGKANGRSPDRVDALVWAIAELLLGVEAQPHVRAL